MTPKKRDEMSFKLKAAPAKPDPPAKAVEKPKHTAAKKAPSTPPEELKGEQLEEKVRTLDVEGRSQMTAEEKRQAVADAQKPKKKDPTVVEVVLVEIGDAHAVLSLDAKQYRLEPAQVAYLAKNMAYMNNDLHVPSNA